MSDIRFSQAAGAYQDALKAAQRIISKAGGDDAGDTDSSSPVSGQSFLDMVGHSLSTSVNAGYKSENVAAQALTGKADLTDVITAVSDAEASLNTVVAIRDRVISAYQDIIKMTI
jgi:flagellar hook-basal body complex protein FliE